jgi:hypothetical protein
VSQQVHAPSTAGLRERRVVDLVRCNDGTSVRRAHAGRSAESHFIREEADEAVAGFDDGPKAPGRRAASSVSSRRSTWAQAMDVAEVR